MKATQLSEEIFRIGRSLFERGYAHATAGNISVRLDDGSMLITPTDACLGFIDPATLAHADAQGRPLNGAAPSKALTLHRRLYEAEPTARCVIHTHSTHCVALTLVSAGPARDALPALTPYFVMKVGHVPLLPYHRPGDPRVADLAAEAIAEARRRGTPIRALLLKRLGPIVWHSTPAAAMATLEELEETARLWWLTAGRPPPLSAGQIDELKAAFDAAW